MDRDRTPSIIAEDKSYLIIEKPSGWVVNDAISAKNSPIVQKWLYEMDFSIAKDNEFRSGIVHRLDKETSGLLLVAKNKNAFANLQSQFKNRLVTKKYLALVHGKVDSEGIIEIKVGRLPWNRRKFGVIPGGRESYTRYKLLDEYIKDNKFFSLVEFSPKTGRTHQIRIHAKYINHPIVADEFYAGRKTARDDRKWCPRLFLHASYIEFSHPDTGQSVMAKSDLPDDLKKILDLVKN